MGSSPGRQNNFKVIVMKPVVKLGVAIAAAAVAAFTTMPAATAGGLFDGMRGSQGSMKDMPRVHGHSNAGRCYLRGDVGYSHAATPLVNVVSPNYAFVGTDDEDIAGAWTGDIGIGCGSGSRGFRADLTLGYIGEREVSGIKTDRPGFHFPAEFSADISTITAMANLYYDFGQVRGFVPYVGVGLGIAHHDLGDVSFTGVGPGVGATFSGLSGRSKTNFAWALMAGVAYQISPRAVFDFGYRFIDLGDVATRRGNICTIACGGSQDRLSINDMYSHEFKIGLRYHFGGRQAPTYK